VLIHIVCRVNNLRYQVKIIIKKVSGWVIPQSHCTCKKIKIFSAVIIKWLVTIVYSQSRDVLLETWDKRFVRNNRKKKIFSCFYFVSSFSRRFNPSIFCIYKKNKRSESVNFHRIFYLFFESCFQGIFCLSEENESEEFGWLIFVVKYVELIVSLPDKVRRHFWNLFAVLMNFLKCFLHFRYFNDKSVGKDASGCIDLIYYKEISQVQWVLNTSQLWGAFPSLRHWSI